MKASGTSTDTLKLRSRAGSRLASMKASMSGWSMRRQPIIAPRRCPAEGMVRHMESHTAMKLSGPEASAPTPFTAAPEGRMAEKSMPTPPPCCMVTAASRTASKMPPRASGTAPMTKQLNRVTFRPVPAPARMRPAGKNWKSVRAASKRSRQRARALGASASATAAATRVHVCPIVSSPPPSDGRKLYLPRQISAARGLANAMLSSSGTKQAGRFRRRRGCAGAMWKDQGSGSLPHMASLLDELLPGDDQLEAETLERWGVRRCDAVDSAAFNAGLSALIELDRPEGEDARRRLDRLQRAEGEGSRRRL